MGYDFSGYATRTDLECSDGRTIREGAFRDNDGQVVPLVWQHMHNDPGNVLGHAKLEYRNDGVYAYGKFNDTSAGLNAKALVEHGDITALSIYANNLIHRGRDVTHGVIREVSLVLSGANPGALIDNLTIMHADGTTDTSDDEAIIYTGLDLEYNKSFSHAEEEDTDVSKNEETVEDVFETLTPKQKDVVYAIVAQILDEQETVEHSGVNDDEEEYDGEDFEDEDDADEEDDETYDDFEDEDEFEHYDEEGEHFMKKNVFDKDGQEDLGYENVLTHAQFGAIVDSAQRFGSFKESFLSHVDAYGIEDINKLFPEVQTVDGMPALITRDMAWVDHVMRNVKNTPFSRIKSTALDITADEARALGYVTGKKKKDEVIKALKRVTMPTTVYKKQKIDRDDVIDITGLDVVAWLKREMRMLLDEELARAFLIGDGRVPGDDKINDDNIRPIYGDDDLYAHPVTVRAATADAIDDIIKARKNYKGSGTPTLYVNGDFLTDMLLLKDLNQRYIYNNEQDLAVKLRVKDIVEVPVMENISREADDDTFELLGIIVNMKDYRVGADKGGQVSMFDDFDIDYNQHKYLIETRCSGALVQPKGALVLERKVVDAGDSTNP